MSSSCFMARRGRRLRLFTRAGKASIPDAVETTGSMVVGRTLLRGLSMCTTAMYMKCDGILPLGQSRCSLHTSCAGRPTITELVCSKSFGDHLPIRQSGANCVTQCRVVPTYPTGKPTGPQRVSCTLCTPVLTRTQPTLSRTPIPDCRANCHNEHCIGNIARRPNEPRLQPQ